MATITTYQLQVMDPIIEGLHPVIPIKRYNAPFTQATASSIEEAKTFDIASSIEQFKGEDGFNINNYSFDYNNNPLLFRYVVYDGTNLLGIANIEGLFTENEKKLEWISVNRMNFDKRLPSSSLENNMQLLEKLAGDLGASNPIFKQVI